MRIRTHSKVNLFLRVLGLRADGYHEIETILQTVGLGDDIDVVPVDSGDVSVDMVLDDGLRGELPRADQNLVFQAASALKDRAGHERGAHITLRKRVPIGAGLGGGSANAAGTLIALNELWAMGLDTTELVAMAAELGSDVPFFIAGGTALATSRGEDLTPLPGPVSLSFVLGISYAPIYSRDVYGQWRDADSANDASSPPVTLALGGGDAREIAALLHNDLEPAILRLRPELDRKKMSLVEAGALGACVSGSGPTVFGVAVDEGHARAIGEKVADQFDRVDIVSSNAESVERLD